METTTTTEITVQLENTPGTLADMTELLSNKGININGFCANAQGSAGFIRFVTADPNQAVQVLEGSDYTCQRRELVVVAVPNKAGELTNVCRKLAQSGVNIESAFVTEGLIGSGPAIAFAVDDLAVATKVLSN